IGDHRGRVLGGHVFGVQDGFERAAVGGAVGVVVMGGDVEAVLFERQLGVIEVDEIGLVFVDEILGAQEPFFGVAVVVRRDRFVPMTVVLRVPVLRFLRRLQI